MQDDQKEKTADTGCLGCLILTGLLGGVGYVAWKYWSIFVAYFTSVGSWTAFLFIALLFIGEVFFEKQSSRSKAWERIFEGWTFFFGAILAISALSVFFYPLIAYSLLGHGRLTAIALVLSGITVASILISLFVIRLTNLFRLKIIFRFLPIVCGLVLSVLVIVDGYHNAFSGVITQLTWYQNAFYHLAVCSLDISIILYGILFFSFFGNNTFLFYRKQEYVLFLRSFSFDKSGSESLLSNVSSAVYNATKMPVLRIGNPNSFFFTISEIDTFYLPTVNWKKRLNELINRATYVFTVVDETPGVLWEMYEHQNCSYKFVYYVSNISRLREILMLPFFESPRVKQDSLTRALVFLASHEEISPNMSHVAFFLRQDEISFSPDAASVMKVFMGKTSSEKVYSANINDSPTCPLGIEPEEIHWFRNREHSIKRT